MKPVLFHPFAEKEFFESADYYEEKVPGLGKDFRREIEKALRQINKFPDAWPKAGRGFRKYLLSKFSYAVVYRVFKGNINIYAVMHLARRPRYWITRKMN